MTQPSPHHPITKRVLNLRILTVACVFLLSTNSVTIYYQLEDIWQQTESVGRFLLLASIWSATTLFAVVILFKACMFHPRFFYPSGAILFILNSMNNAASFQIKGSVNASMMQAAILSPFTDIFAFVSSAQIGVFMLGMCGFVASLFILRQAFLFRDDLKAHVLCGAFVTFILASDSSMIFSNQPPFQAIKPLIHLLLPFHYGPIQDATLFTTQDKNPNIYVLVIGESARADHFQLNGYDKPTNPYLSKLKHIISYKDVHSCTALTHTALTCMLTDATLKDFENIDNAMLLPWGFSLVEGFKRAGFYTGWIGMQAYRGVSTMPYIEIADTSHYTTFPGSYTSFGKPPYDEILLNKIDPFLAATPNTPKLLIVHLYGSHFPYEIRYPASFKKFAPTCDSTNEVLDIIAQSNQECDKRHAGSVSNSYDNSLIYTDYVLSKIIEKLNNQRALLMYISDHGESLGEKGQYLHGKMKVPEQRHIPLIIWASDNYIHAYPNEWDTLAQHASLPISQDHIFHSFIDCAHISSTRLDKKLSLCSHDVTPRIPELHTR